MNIYQISSLTFFAFGVLLFFVGTLRLEDKDSPQMVVIVYMQSVIFLLASIVVYIWGK